jgi:Zn-finger nucleic acid-binding protein
MICPRCGMELTEIVKTGVAIDTCTSCSGIWLDKGKLGALINQLKQAEVALEQELNIRREMRPEPRYPERERVYGSDHHDNHHDDHDSDKHKHGKKSFFDFFD